MESYVSMCYRGKSISMFIFDKQVWFRGYDITSVLGFKRSYAHIKESLPRNCRKTFKYEVLGSYFNQTYVNECGVCRLILMSKLKEKDTKKFKKWFFDIALNVMVKNNEITNTHNLHLAIVNFIYSEYPSVIIIPNLPEVQDTMKKKSDSRKKGYLPDQPNIMIPLSSGGRIGLAIELLDPINEMGLSDGKRNYLTYLWQAGWRVCISGSYIEIVKIITEYLDSIKFKCRICESYFKGCDELKEHEDMKICKAKKRTIKKENWRAVFENDITETYIKKETGGKSVTFSDFPHS